MKKLGLTQGDLAKKIDMKPARINQVLHNKTHIPSKLKQKIAVALDCEVEVLFNDS